MTSSNAAPRFGRVITAMVTPFDDAGALDLDAAVQLARWLAAHGSDGLVLTGSTGESSVLTDDEKADLWRAVAEAVTIPVIAGSGSNDTEHSINMTARAAECGVDGILLVTPYYNRPSQAGIAEHFRRGRRSGARPAGRPLRHPGAGRSAHRHLHHAAPGPRGARTSSPSRTRRPTRPAPPTWPRKLPAGFEIYSGDDVMTLPLMAVGAIGVISVAAHWAAPQFRAVIDAVHGRRRRPAPSRPTPSCSTPSTSIEHRRLPEPAAGQGHVPGHGIGRRSMPTPDGCVHARARCHGGQGPGRRRPPAATGQPLA